MAYFLNFNSYYHITPPTPPSPPPIPSTYPFFWKTEGAATAKFGGKFKKRKREKLILETRENKFWKGPKLRKKWLNVKNLTEQFHVSIFSCAFYSWIMVFIVPSWFKNDIKKIIFLMMVTFMAQVWAGEVVTSLFQCKANEGKNFLWSMGNHGTVCLGC